MSHGLLQFLRKVGRGGVIKKKFLSLTKDMFFSMCAWKKCSGEAVHPMILLFFALFKLIASFELTASL